MSFHHRSYEKELLDRDDIPFNDIRRNMDELDFINTYLGGHAITTSGLQLLLKSQDRRKHWLICEIGCGGGDNLIAIQKWLSKRNIAASFVGIDINPFCIEVARDKCAGLNSKFIASDYKLVTLETKPDIIFSSLFCHHFTDEDLTWMLQWMDSNTVTGFFINELHRHPLAYYSIKMLTALFSASYLVKNDAPLSVLRGFTKNEWQQLLLSAGINRYAIRWKWAFRYLVTVKKRPALVTDTTS